jgi:16S rRNA C967 or C1407 C5-methylase (RsmB/RsmF family)
MYLVLKLTREFLWIDVLEDMGAYASRAEARKAARRLKTGQNVGERLPPIKGFLPRSFDRVLLDAPCSALGLRPRLFAGQVLANQSRIMVKEQHPAYFRGKAC